MLLYPLRRHPKKCALVAYLCYVMYTKRQREAAAAAAAAASALQRKGFATVNGVELYFEFYGDESKPKLLFVPGSMCDLRKPMYQQALTVLSEHFHVLAYDHRGMGQSTMDTESSHYSMAGYANDACALCENMGWDSCHVMGVSFGGMVAQEIALRAPQLLHSHSLVLACTSAGGSGGSSIALHKLARLSDFSFGYQFIRKTDTNLQKWHWSWMPVLSGFLFMVLGKAKHLDPDKREVYWNTCRHLQFMARNHHDTTDRLGSLCCRTLVCGGDRDEVAPVQNLRALHRLIPGAVLMLFSGGHGFLAQDPRALTAVIAFMLGSMPPGKMCKAK